MKLLFNQDIGWRTGASPDLYLPLCKIVESATIHIFLSKIFLSYDSTKENANRLKNSTLTLQVSHDHTVQNPHLVEIKGNKVVTNSLLIAQIFEKRHDNVLRDIEKILNECSPKFNALNFEAVKYLDSKNEERPMYNLTRDGATMLIMSYTGPKAMEFKIAYINEFNRMEKVLQEMKFGRQGIDLLELRKKVKVIESDTSEGIRRFYHARETVQALGLYSKYTYFLNKHLIKNHFLIGITKKGGEIFIEEDLVKLLMHEQDIHLLNKKIKARESTFVFNTKILFQPVKK